MSDVNETTEMMRRVETIIVRKIKEAFSPSFLEVVNESYKHNVPKDSETHFKVVVVSNSFDGRSLIERHRMVNSILAEELRSGVHALSIQAKTADQWASNQTIASTPPCLGGDK